MDFSEIVFLYEDQKRLNCSIVGLDMLFIISCFSVFEWDGVVWARGLHGPDFSVQARPGPHGYDLGPARPEAKKKVSARPVRKIKI